MSCCPFNWSMIGAVLAGLAVILGAFAAHGIDGYFAEKYDGQVKSIAGSEVPAAQKYLKDFKTGAEYQMYHALALILVGFAGLTSQKKKLLNCAGWCFLLGIIFFSGSLYVLTLSGQTFWGAIAPIGGTLFIVGWFTFAAGICCCGSDSNSEVLSAPETPSST
ncbi:DUF423 domain-containing protein [Gimesia aquarii]|uniref:DUF423 domain-containing protein n=1 Tax=Gimesia aquarii TaxID=2527964 RepID=A0A517VP38_9PLAN|nr:DUF423 domain-containing protein [Gimesia aquarii]QDT94778.1 hypothetical protein V144x_02090 [Gimesia aquarii]